MAIIIIPQLYGYTINSFNKMSVKIAHRRPISTLVLTRQRQPATVQLKLDDCRWPAQRRPAGNHGDVTLQGDDVGGVVVWIGSRRVERLEGCACDTSVKRRYHVYVWTETYSFDRQ